MTFSPLTNGIQLTADSSKRTAKIDRFIVHHAATTSLAAILSLFQPGGRTVSANYALGNDGTLIGAVDEDRRAWTSSSATWDGRAVTIEVANSVAGGSWPVSDATFHKLARLIADVATRYGFPIDDNHVLTHQELYIRYGASYATSCPGDLQRRKPELLALARHYQAVAFTPQPTTRKKTDMSNITFYSRVRPDGKGGFEDSGDWTIAGLDLFLDEEANTRFEETRIMTFPGFWATDSGVVAQRWGRQFSFYPPETLAVRLEQEAYEAQQALMVDMHLKYVAGLRQSLGL